MRLYGAGSVSTPARTTIDALPLVASLLVVTQAAEVAVLLVNPLHPLREYFQVTTMAVVPEEVWHPEGIVRVEGDLAVVILAEVFRAGAGLQDDQALTV